MEEHISDVPEGLDAATLTPIVERVLDTQELRITAWRCTRLHGGNAGSVFRLGGDAETQSRSTPWSVVLKIPSREASPADPSGGTHEPVIYRSMFLRELPACLAAPRCFGVVEQPSGQHWLWLEDVPHASVAWGWDCYADVARRLGQFNGTFLVGRPLPAWPWLGTTSQIHDYVARLWPSADQLRDTIAVWDRRSELPRDTADQLLRLHAERAVFLEQLDRLPVTLCHGDAFQRNLLVDNPTGVPTRVVAVDWACAGMGVLGEDLHRLVNHSALFAYLAPAQLPALDRVVFPAYIQGLRAAGWRGNEQQVRFGYAASSALIEGMLVGDTGLQLCADEKNHQWLRDRCGWSDDDIPQRMIGILHYQLDLAAEARALLAA